MSTRLRWRKFVSNFMLTLTGVCAAVAVSVLFFILGYLVYHGGTSISWNFFTKLPVPVGELGGGMANAIVAAQNSYFSLLYLGCPSDSSAGSTFLNSAILRSPLSCATLQTCSMACLPS